MRNCIKQNITIIILLLLLIYVALFNQLGSSPLALWDESVYALNTLEMYFNNVFLVRYYNGKIDTWTVIPPFTTWIQLCFVKIFGFSNLVFRLPSALAPLVIIAFSIYFTYKSFNNFLLGIFATMILLTSKGYIDSHVTRTGDLDSILVMFTFLASIYYFMYLESWNNKFLLLTMLFFLLAFFTKSIAAFFFVPGLVFYTLITRNLKRVLLSKYLYYSIIGASAIIFLYYAFVEYKYPGFVNQVIHRASIGRFFTTMEGHSGGFLFYFNNLINSRFAPWLFFLPLSFFFIFINKNNPFRKICILLIINCLSYLLLISFSSTKLIWYDAQIFPQLALLGAVSIFSIYNLFQDQLKLKNVILKNVFSLFFVMAFFYFPSKQIYDKIMIDKTIKSNDQKYCLAMKNIYDKKITQAYTILYTGFNPHVQYYSSLYNKTLGTQIDLRNVEDHIHIETNSLVLFYHPKIYETIYHYFNYEIKNEYKDFKLVKILDKKKTKEG